MGGLALGEPADLTWRAVEVTADTLPADRPRYLMGMGTPMDILDGIQRGMDMFDCVMPTRNARNGTLFTSRGRYSVKVAAHRDDSSPPDPDCRCFTCRNFSRAYLRHLFLTGEMLASRLNTLHNLTFYLGLMRRAREAIEAGSFEGFRRDFVEGPACANEER